MLFFGVVGIMFWGVAALVLWGIDSARFRDLTNRSPFRRPRVVRQGPGARLRSPSPSRNGVAPPPVQASPAAELLEALPAEPDEESILDVLRVEDSPRGE